MVLLRLIKLTRRLADPTLKYYVAYDYPNLKLTVYHQKCSARRYPIGSFANNLYRFSSIEGEQFQVKGYNRLH
jgi:hypothetical protein